MLELLPDKKRCSREPSRGPDSAYCLSGSRAPALIKSLNRPTGAALLADFRSLRGSVQIANVHSKGSFVPLQSERYREWRPKVREMAKMAAKLSRPARRRPVRRTKGRSPVCELSPTSRSSRQGRSEPLMITRTQPELSALGLCCRASNNNKLARVSSIYQV